MVRSSFESNGMRKGAWSKEEDNKLKAFIQIYGHRNWRLLPKYAGLARCGKSCRLRWVNYLKPGVKRGNFTDEEHVLIMNLHAKLGNKWSIIASKLPGRTDNEVKNYWHTHIKKHSQKQNAVAKEEISSPEEQSAETKSCLTTPNELAPAFMPSEASVQTDLQVIKPFPDLISSDSFESLDSFGDLEASFWNDTFLNDSTFYGHSNYLQPLEGFYDFQIFSVLSYNDVSSSSELSSSNESSSITSSEEWERSFWNEPFL